MTFSPEVCLRARALVADRLGLDFPEERQADLTRELGQAVLTSSHSAPEPHRMWLATAPEDDPELRRLAAHLTVGETYFFRERATFEAPQAQVLPALIAALLRKVREALDAARRAPRAAAADDMDRFQGDETDA